ncbi:MAG: hypothetical protein K9G62_04990 [Alphaproteobacteria bacterium]|nr:hypothetical protein [Alphaproteobacteria bacterium]
MSYIGGIPITEPKERGNMSDKWVQFLSNIKETYNEEPLCRLYYEDEEAAELFIQRVQEAKTPSVSLSIKEAFTKLGDYEEKLMENQILSDGELLNDGSESINCYQLIFEKAGGDPDKAADIALTYEAVRYPPHKNQNLFLKEILDFLPLDFKK